MQVNIAVVATAHEEDASFDVGNAGSHLTATSQRRPVDRAKVVAYGEQPQRTEVYAGGSEILQVGGSPVTVLSRIRHLRSRGSLIQTWGRRRGRPAPCFVRAHLQRPPRTKARPHGWLSIGQPFRWRDSVAQIQIEKSIQQLEQLWSQECRLLLIGRSNTVRRQCTCATKTALLRLTERAAYG